jgi:hypothetical protein
MRFLPHGKAGHRGGGHGMKPEQQSLKPYAAHRIFSRA